MLQLGKVIRERMDENGVVDVAEVEAWVKTTKVGVMMPPIEECRCLMDDYVPDEAWEDFLESLTEVYGLGRFDVLAGGLWVCEWDEWWYEHKEDYV